MTSFHRWLVVFSCLLTALASTGVAAAATSDAKLLRTYQPVTSFDPQERFFPTSVQSFVADSTLEQLGPSGWTVVDPDPEPGDLPGPGTGIWRLNQQPCTPALQLGGLACYLAAWQEDSGGNAVYGRVARSENAIVLQYWYFYYDDTYSYLYPPSDFIWQAHEGDWEVVNVVLSSEEQPLSVGYSQHCLGELRDWAHTSLVAGTHPLAFVAVGSHANYFTAGVHPFDARCVPQEVQAILLALGLPLPNDYAFGGQLAGPTEGDGSVHPIRRIDESVPAWLNFPGFWGEVQYFHGPGPIGTVPFGTSPMGPAFHGVWSDPLGTLATWTAS